MKKQAFRLLFCFLWEKWHIHIYLYIRQNYVKGNIFIFIYIFVKIMTKAAYSRLSIYSSKLWQRQHIHVYLYIRQKHAQNHHILCEYLQPYEKLLPSDCKSAKRTKNRKNRGKVIAVSFYSWMKNNCKMNAVRLITTSCWQFENTPFNTANPRNSLRISLIVRVRPSTWTSSTPCCGSRIIPLICGIWSSIFIKRSKRSAAKMSFLSGATSVTLMSIGWIVTPTPTNRMIRTPSAPTAANIWCNTLGLSLNHERKERKGKNKRKKQFFLLFSLFFVAVLWQYVCYNK